MMGRLLEKIRYRLKKNFGGLISQSKFLTALFYLFDKRAFADEQTSVFSGVVTNMGDKMNVGNFRRNVHRIEKGLISEPLKPVFAESYIKETVEGFLVFKKHFPNDSTLEWAEKTLKNYFKVVEKTPGIKRAEDLFRSVVESEFHEEFFLGPKKVIKDFSFDDFRDLNIQRRSVRYYQNKEVPRELVESALSVALMAPSACNRQPFVFRIINDEKKLKVASKLPNGANVFADNIKMMVFVIGDLSNYFDERDKHLIYIDGSLVAMNFLLALETLGLSSCIINWSDLPEKNQELKRLLGLNNWEQCVMAISIGYASETGKIPSSFKKEVGQVIKYN